MADMDALSHLNDETDEYEVSSQEPIRRAPEPADDSLPSDDSIEIDRSTVGYAILALILLVGACAAGWVIGGSSDQAASGPISRTINAQVSGNGGAVTPAATAQPVTPRPYQATGTPGRDIDVQVLARQVNPPAGFRLPAKFGNIGTQLVAAGAIDYKRFVDSYTRAGRPLTERQLAILTKGSDDPIVANAEDAQFLLNFFWALGLSNKNRVLTEGPMMQYGQENIGAFASTGGWTLGAKSSTRLYSTASIITLTSEQQARLEQVAAGVYRPCCNNPTHFPDCNHGMAMLGLLEVMASQDASVDDMFEAAKHVNAFWFPQQALEVAIFLKAYRGLDFGQAEPREMVGRELFSVAGFRAVHQWLVANDLIGQAPGGGSSCGVQ